jgi:putative ABC transport system permease protein
MGLQQSMSRAFLAMRTVWFRSLLSMFGIVLSVALVIVICGFAGKVYGSYQTKLDPLSTSMSLTEGQPNSPKATGMQSLDNSDIEALQQRLDPKLVSAVVPIASGTAMLRYQRTLFRASIIGSTPDWLNYKATQLVAGRMFTEQEYESAARVTVIGPSTLSGLFNNDIQKALRSEIQIGRLTFQIIGVLAHNATGNGGSIAVSPLPVVREDLLGGIRTVGEIGIVMTSKDAVDEVNDEISAILDRQHIPFKANGLEEDFSTSTYQSADIAVAGQLVEVLFWGSCALVVLALIIGGGGLSNVMSFSVAERAREIAVRRTFGARRRMIVAQLLSESVVIAGTGGALGVLVGVALVVACERVLPNIAPQLEAPELSVSFVLLAFVLSLVVGVVAGMHPALRAARYRICDVLRD